MEATATFTGGRRSIRLFAAILALAAVFVLGGAGGYVVKALTATTTTSTQIVVVPAASPKQTILPNQT